MGTENLNANTQGEHRVFVYGTLLRGESNAHWAKDARRENAIAFGTLYDTGWGFPAFVPNGSMVVYGELLSVNDKGLVAMDCLEGYPHLYRREEIEVFTEAGKRLIAWVYVLNKMPEGARQIARGDWRTR